MATKILDPKSNQHLQPAYGLWQQYQPEKAKYAFRARTRAEGLAWQAETRRALAQAIGLQLQDGSPLNPELVEVVDKDDYLRKKVLIQTSLHSQMPVYLLIPKEAHQPLPVVLAFHGHGYGVKDIVGLWEDGEERDTPEGYHKDFGVALCRAGFAVAAPEIACFGERQTDFSHLQTPLAPPVPSSCTQAAFLAFHLGSSVVGMRVRDGMRLVDYLETCPEFDTRRLGAMGISGGGMHTFFSTCLDERIRACVISGYFSTFRDSILAMEHCPCNFVPGLGEFGEMYDLAGLIAPRPMLVEAGNYDNIFPLGAVKSSVEKANAVFATLGASDPIETDYFEGRHQISGQKAYSFLKEKLGAD
jgi:dienelactone hydrolase